MVDRVWRMADCGLAAGPWRVVDRGLWRIDCGLWSNRLRKRSELCRTVDLEPRGLGTVGWVRKISTMKSNVGG